MKFDQNEDLDEPIRPKSIVPPMKKGSGAIRFRIFTLVAMLVLVIVAMIEAGKPERWEWMGFEKEKPSVVKKSADTPASDLTATPAANIKFADTAKQQDTSHDDSTNPETTNAAIDKFSPNLSSFMLPDSNQEQYPKAATDFWQSLVNKMNPSQQKLFLQMLHSLRNHKRIDEDQKPKASSLVSAIKKKRVRFHQDVFDQVALTPEGTEKKNLSEQLNLSQTIWEKKILPALQSASKGEDITLSQLQAVHRLQKAIDPIVMKQVQDKTALGWAGDTESWKRIWENVIGVSIGAIEPDFEKVTRIQLMSRPQYFRGKPVTIAGWVRSVKRVAAPEDSEIGIEEYFELWIRPKESKLGPFCVLIKSLPDDFPVATDQTTNVNEQVELGGYFFKVRTYVSGDTSVRNAPTLIAANLTSIAPVEFTSVSNWQPSWMTLICFFITIPIVATAIAVWVYQTSNTKSFEPGKVTSNKINKSLQGLATDPTIQTDAEKIQALYDRDPT